MSKAGFLFTLLIDFMRIGLGAYSIHVKTMHNAIPEYKAQCDLSDYVSCSKTLNSKFGTGFGLIGPLLGDDHPLNISNGYYGLAFFVLHLILVLLARGKTGAKVRFITSVMMGCGCAWLAYVLFFVLKHVCLICIPMYLLNLVVIIVDFVHLRRMGARRRRDEQKKVK